SSDSSEESVGTSTERVILFSTIPTTIPDTTLFFDPSEDLSSDHIPPLPATSPFLSSIDDSSYSDIPNTLPSPTHGTPFTETTLSTQSSPVASGALRLDYSSSDYFSSDDSLREPYASSFNRAILSGILLRMPLSDSASKRDDRQSPDSNLHKPFSGKRVYAPALRSVERAALSHLPL
ncbi:hypothetical protein Tco_1161532, partial [Tanacetum coccineum]